MKNIITKFLILLCFLPAIAGAQNNDFDFSRLGGDAAERADLIRTITYDSAENNLFFAMSSLKYYPMPYHNSSVLYKTDVHGNVIKEHVDSLAGYAITYFLFYSVMISNIYIGEA